MNRTGLETFDFHLPEELIAQAPAGRRDASRLMVLERAAGATSLARFADLPDLLPPGALLVANNTRVLPARLLASKPTGGAVEMLLLTPLPLLEIHDAQDGWREAQALALLRASKKPRPGQELAFDPDLTVRVLERGDFGRCRVTLRFRGDLRALFERIGHIPLPPYIRRPDSEADRERYQTLHSRSDKQGSAAAPTAGLHFTPEVRAALEARGFGWAEATLHVGYGTFSPVRAEDIRDHRMHAEWAEIPEETARAVLLAKQQGRPVVAVGTTSARALEGAFRACGEIRPFAGETDIFIRPGYRFAVLDGLLTNFHLPRSSLVIMVCALAGTDAVLSAYARAVRERFRFFSYGDAMLIR
ncbi:S-adenosylmethionine:tRNA ribosyltransferase-isomerase [Fundidesulfovibrio magnetotacticus]|uniref:S-adenosylmethionine:tRNA ribosyltransferase-isomerase n=1 Tax=Fundidesulfovibrio magnetotacticus TaxID=2730080 RepID=A0A6V8LPH1_9BACT|nr:tRNA preQ1(34) S-adenosylmethionine ribosyltransferase-isomerase QueA [Fundidesulfovibrio magnetotacticus]GFK92900.1 S-adenosylmethionine:tRNA ribosyltransferase-isomerase [Fundidesulfovibrio magnetotacticus]